jgi:hypothetical protein
MRLLAVGRWLQRVAAFVRTCDASVETGDMSRRLLLPACLHACMPCAHMAIAMWPHRGYVPELCAGLMLPCCSHSMDATICSVEPRILGRAGRATRARRRHSLACRRSRQRWASVPTGSHATLCACAAACVASCEQSFIWPKYRHTRAWNSLPKPCAPMTTASGYQHLARRPETNLCLMRQNRMGRSGLDCSALAC